MIDVWKAAAGILFSILTTGLVSWFSFGAGTATKAEVIDATTKNERKVELNTKAINALQVILSRIETKLEVVAEDIQEIKQERR